MAAQAYLKLGEVSVESGKLNMAVLFFRAMLSLWP